MKKIELVKLIRNPDTSPEDKEYYLNVLVPNNPILFQQFDPETQMDEIREFTTYAYKNEPLSYKDTHWNLFHPLCRKAWIEQGMFPGEWHRDPTEVKI